MKTLRDQVHQVFEQCQQRYSAIQLSFEDFWQRIKEILASQRGVEAATAAMPRQGAVFSQLHHEDLFLAIACARGDRVAWEYFVDEFVPTLRRHAAFACRHPDAGEDLAQEIVTSLLGGEAAETSERGKLGSYNGRGSLGAWLRVVVSHAAIDRIRRAKKEVALNDGIELNSASVSESDSAAKDRAADTMDSRWGPVFSTVLAAEIRSLPSKDRLLLSLYYLQEVPLKAIGRHFGVHEATASRWLEGLRRSIRRRVERELRKKHGLSPSDIRSLWHWISEEESFSLSALLRMRKEPAETSGN
jgi:RNA polymerase sigma-70 factor (ECF subfamily)